MAGTGTFGVVKLGTDGAEKTLPEFTEFHEDPIRQGAQHLLLSGKVRADFLGERFHFYFGFKGLTEAEYTSLQSAWNAVEPLNLLTHDREVRVVRGNHAPKTYDSVGNISTAIELDETR